VNSRSRSKRHPVGRRRTFRGANHSQGAEVERPTGRTSLAPWPWSTRLVWVVGGRDGSSTSWLGGCRRRLPHAVSLVLGPVDLALLRVCLLVPKAPRGFWSCGSSARRRRVTCEPTRQAQRQPTNGSTMGLHHGASTTAGGGRASRAAAADRGLHRSGMPCDGHPIDPVMGAPQMYTFPASKTRLDPSSDSGQRHPQLPP
jgi:hypothetical protein